MEGVENATWSIGTSNNKRTYSETHKWLDSVTYVWGSKYVESQPIAIGAYKYDFSCLIPANVPYTLEGEYGYVRFKVDANLDIPWARDLHSEKAFTVMRQDDLNLFPLLKIPVEVEESVVFCTCWCNSDPFVMTLQVPKQGYALGEEIEVHVSLVNKSTIKVFSTTLKLERVFKYITGEHSIEECKEIVSKSCRGVDAGQRITFDKRIMIPTNAYTSTDNYCRIFKVMYRIELKVSSDSCSAPILHLPITVGTIGFRAVQTVQTVQPSAPAEDSMPIETYRPVPASAPVPVRENLDLRKEIIKARKFLVIPNLIFFSAPSYNELVLEG